MAENQRPTKDQIPLNFPLTLNRDVFETEDGRKVGYFNFKLDVDGEVFTLNLKADDKKLFKYLMKDVLDVEL